MPNTVINAMQFGGADSRPAPSMLDHYGWMLQGPDTKDAVVLNRPIDQNVRPDTCLTRVLPKGRIFSLTPDGTMIPGVKDDQVFPVATILIGSDADSGDVVGGLRTGDPANYRYAQVPFKDEANAPFWSLGAGYIYETSEFQPADMASLIPGTVLSAKHSMTDFDIAGFLKIANVYVDHVIGVVVDRPRECGANKDIMTVCFMGAVIPRLPAATIANLK